MKCPICSKEHDPFTHSLGKLANPRVLVEALSCHGYDCLSRTHTIGSITWEISGLGTVEAKSIDELAGKLKKMIKQEVENELSNLREDA